MRPGPERAERRGGRGLDQAGGGAGTGRGLGLRKDASIVINYLSSGSLRAWAPANLVCDGEDSCGTPPLPTLVPRPDAGEAKEAFQLDRQCSRGPGPPILQLPPETIAHVLDMLEPLEVAAAGVAHTDWLEVANRLVLAPRGHLVVRLGLDEDAEGAWRACWLKPAVHTLHLVGTAPRGLDAEQVRAALQALARTLPMDAVHTVWLHEDGVADDGEYRPDAAYRATIDAVLGLCTQVAAVSFSNVRQSARLARLLVDAGPRPGLRVRFVFSERNHHATSVLAALDELGAFFEETVVTVWRPQLSVTASYPHYWQPGCELRLPYPSEVRSLCLCGAGLEPGAYRGVAAMPALRELRLCDADGLGDDALEAMAAGLRRLRRLAVHDAPGVSSGGWAAALRGPALRHLESLEVGGCPQLDDEALCAMQPEDVLEELTVVALDLEGCVKATGAAVEALTSACPNIESLTLVVAFSPSLVDALERTPSSLRHLKRLSVRVQGSGWPGDPKEVIAGVDRLKRHLRAFCPASVQMDVNLTFIKLGMAVSASPEDQLHD